MSAARRSVSRSTLKRLSSAEAVAIFTILQGDFNRVMPVTHTIARKLAKRGLVDIVEDKIIVSPAGHAAFRTWQGTR